MTIGRRRVEQLSRVEAVLTVAADVGDDRIEIVEHDILLRLAAASVRPVRLAHRLAEWRCNPVEERLQIRLLAVDVIGM